MDPSDAELINEALNGQSASFEKLVSRYQPRVFATARKYARRESEVEDIAQEVFLKVFIKMNSFRGESPFEHWLMRLTVRTCYDFLRAHRRNREQAFSEITREDAGWLEKIASGEDVGGTQSAAAARVVIHKLLERLSPESRLIIQLLEIEEKSLKEIARLTGWSIPMIKVRAFRARAAMRKALRRLETDRYL